MNLDEYCTCFHNRNPIIANQYIDVTDLSTRLYEKNICVRAYSNCETYEVLNYDSTIASIYCRIVLSVHENDEHARFVCGGGRKSKFLRLLWQRRIRSNLPWLYLPDPQLRVPFFFCLYSHVCLFCVSKLVSPPDPITRSNQYSIGPT